MRKEWHLKIAPIAGDLTLSGLGLSPEDREIVSNEV
jgi:hypothetical protein